MFRNSSSETAWKSRAMYETCASAKLEQIVGQLRLRPWCNSI